MVDLGLSIVNGEDPERDGPVRDGRAQVRRVESPLVLALSSFRAHQMVSFSSGLTSPVERNRSWRTLILPPTSLTV